MIYSGGPTNTNPQASLGGQASTASGRYVLSQDFTMTAIPGVTVQYVFGAPLGAGTLTYNYAGNYLLWEPASGPTFITVSLDVAGRYALGDDASVTFMQVEVAPGLLPASTTPTAVTIADKIDSVFVPPTGTDMVVGATSNIILYAYNESATDVLDMRVVLTQSTPITDVQIAGIFPQTSRFLTPNLQYTNSLRGCAAFGTPTLRLAANSGFSEHLNTIYHATPQTLYSPYYRGQASDGISVDLAPTIATPADTAGVLSGYDWGTEIDIPLIPAGKMVSFALRRVVLPGTVTYSPESITLTMSLQI